jgi:branched-chain amino acid transport system ATP-binding protein
MLEVDGLVCGYGSLPVIHGLSFGLEVGESIAILGANGAGKSTLLKTVARWLPVQAGAIRWDGHDATAWSPEHMTKAGLAFVPQDNKVFPALSVAENLEISADLHADGRNRLADAYARFPLLRERQNQKAGSLSGGERQLVAVLSALILSPKLLVLDEPTMGLSPVMVERVTELIRSVIDSGVSVVWVVEQDPETALEVVDRAYVMAGGRLGQSLSGQALKTTDLSSVLLGG